MDELESTKPKQTPERLLPFNWNEVRSQTHPGEEHKIGHIPPILLPSIAQPDSSVQHQHSITNQSELSIGNKTAELLVGDILASDELSQNSQEEIKLEQVLVIPESTSLHRELRVNKIQPNCGVTGAQSAMNMNDQIRNEVLSPSRLLSSEHDVTGEQHSGDETAFENPFEMAQNEKLIIDEDTLLKDVQLADNGKKLEPSLNTAQEKDAQEQMMKVEQEETKDYAPGNDALQNEQALNSLGLTKQRSNSASNLNEKSGTEKKARRRKLLQKITLFGEKVYETVGGTQQQPPSSQDHQDNAEKLVTASTGQDGRASLTQTKEKKSIISKLFSRKDKDQIVEESKATSMNFGPPALLSPQGKAGVKSRFVNFFKKTSKFTNTKKQSDSQQEPAASDIVAVQEEEKQHEVMEKVVEPESSLDTGFRANIADSYGLDDDQEDERVHDENNSNSASGQFEAAAGAIPGNQDQDQDETYSDDRRDDDEETDVEDESEDTNDEIFSAHEGLDFRPNNAGLFSFPENAEGQQPQRFSNQSVSNNQRQSLPMSQSSGENSQQATGGVSVGSLEDQQHQQTQFQPHRRAQSQCAEDLTVLRQQTAEGDEWEVSFGQPLNEGNHSLTDQQLLQPQQHPFPTADQTNAQQQQLLGANASNNQYMMTIPPIYNRLSAGFLRQGRSSLLGGPAPTTNMMTGYDSSNMAVNAANCDPFVPSETQTQIGEFGRVIYDKDSVRRSTSFQNTQNKVAQFFSHLQQSQNPNQQSNVGDANNLQIPPYQQQQQHQYQHTPMPSLRISEPFMPSSYVHEQQYHVQKQVHSLGAIQNHHGHDGNTPFQGLQQNACPFGQTPQYTYKGLKPYQGGYDYYQVHNNQNSGPNNMSGSKNTTQQLENPYKRQSTSNQMYGFENGRESLTTSRGGLSHSSSSRSGFQRGGGNPPRPTRNPRSQYNLSDKNSQNAQTSNNTKDKHQTTPNQDDNDSNTCSSLSGLANNKRKRRTRKRGGTSEKVNAEGTGAESVVSGDGQIVPVIQCYCCSSGAISCLLATKIDDYNHLSKEERIKQLILADQHLLHFQPIDTRKTGGSAQNCARAGIEGKIKDDIWHECCPCCESVRNTLLSEMKGIASELCRDQICSKFIQVQLSRCPVTDQAVIDAFYAEIIQDEELLFLKTQKDKASQEPEQPLVGAAGPTENNTGMMNPGEKLHETSLMKNVFGNYVIQLLFEKGSKEQIDQFYQCMLQQCYKLANDSFGCRILQKALVFLPLPQQLEIVQKFQYCKLFEMMLCEEGNYIIQCIIYSVPAEHIQFFLPTIEQRLIQLCRDKRGCRIIQRTLEKFPYKDIENLINEIIKNANDLTPQSYGNYVITHILNNGLESDRNKIINTIMENMIHFSLYQLGSNVVENCLRMAPDDLKEEILKRVDALPLTTTFENPQISLSMLLENQFGNYVIQHAFHLADETRKRRLRDRINQAADEGFVVRSNNYAKHVYTLMHAHFISECADCASRAKNDPPQAIEVPTLAEKYSRSAQIQRNLEFRIKAGEKIISTESVAAKMEQHKPEKREATQNKSTTSGCRRRKKPDPQAKEQAYPKQETPAEEEKEQSLQSGIDQTKINTAAEIGAFSKDDISNEDNRLNDDDDDRSQNSQDDKLLGPDGADGAEGEKKKRRRRRKRKAKKGGICQEDVLEALSDSDREEFLANQQILMPGQVNSLFVLDPQSASRKRHSKTTREFLIDGEESSEMTFKQETGGLTIAKQKGVDQGELSADESNDDNGVCEESKD